MDCNIPHCMYNIYIIYIYFYPFKPNSAKHDFCTCSRAGNHDWVQPPRMDGLPILLPTGRRTCPQATMKSLAAAGDKRPAPKYPTPIVPKRCLWRSYLNEDQAAAAAVRAWATGGGKANFKSVALASSK